MDYIFPATCTDTEFRQMWQDFEWENKVNSFYTSYLCNVFHGSNFLGVREHNVDRSTRLLEAFAKVNQHEMFDTREGSFRSVWIYGGQHVRPVRSKNITVMLCIVL